MHARSGEGFFQGEMRSVRSVSRRYLGMQREVAPQIKSPFFNLQDFCRVKFSPFLNDEFAEEVASTQWEFGFMYFALFFVAPVLWVRIAQVRIVRRRK